MKMTRNIQLDARWCPPVTFGGNCYSSLVCCSMRFPILTTRSTKMWRRGSDGHSIQPKGFLSRWSNERRRKNRAWK